MSDKESHPIRNSVIASVIGGIILSFWPPFREFLVNTASWFWGVIKSFGTWLSTTQDIYGWVLLLLIALSIPTLVKAISLVAKKREPGVEDLYNSDYLFGANWHWTYFNGSIHNLWCLCPSCKNELVYSEFRPDRYNFDHAGLELKTSFDCERCNTSPCTLKGNKEYALGTVEREIRRKIRNDEWQRQESS